MEKMFLVWSAGCKKVLLVSGGALQVIWKKIWLGLLTIKSFGTELQ